MLPQLPNALVGGKIVSWNQGFWRNTESKEISACIQNFVPIKLSFFANYKVVFELLEILELFEYLATKYSIFEVELFLLESETLLFINEKRDA